MKRTLLLALACLATLVALSGTAVAQEVSLESLLSEATDRSAITLMPNYVCRQASSYDRASKSPDENWFANNDTSQFIRSEKNGDREEWVLLDAEGPGAIVRWWITAPHYKNNVYVYIDGALAFSGKIDEYIGGNALVGAPLSEETSRGRNLYLPIPYAKSVKVTVDQMSDQGNLYYQIVYRTYPKETTVESFSIDNLEKARADVDATNAILLEPDAAYAGKKPKAEIQGFKRRIPADMVAALYEEHRIFGPGAIMEIDVKLDAKDLAQAARSLALVVSFDGEETVWAPIGEFCGSGVGINPVKTWYAQVGEDGLFKAFWRMPFQREARVSFVNFGDQDVSIDYAVYYEKTPWREKDMYFHANWRQERGVKTTGGQGVRDWNYTAIQGAGVYVGDVLSVVNPVSAWWGEGDEKIYVDGETFPSHFGTGTEDYYGYAWCCPDRFESPFHAQPIAEGPGNFGNTTVERYRLLDGVPFTKDFKFDMEIWHWETCLVDYAATTFWYGAPGAKIVAPGPDRAALQDEASAPVQTKHKMTLKTRDFSFDEFDGSGSITIQDMAGFKKDAFQWLDNRQIWWRDGKIGDQMILKLIAAPSGKKELHVGVTVARDYGVAQFYLNDQPIGEPYDCFNYPNVEHRDLTFKVDAAPRDAGTLTVKLVGKNEKSEGTMLGVDYVEWK